MITFKQFLKLSESTTSHGDGFRLIHYAGKPLEHLSTEHHGSGIADAADRRLRNDGEDKSPVSKRIYFYTQHHNGKMPEPEAGLGNHVHELDHSKLKLYDHSKASKEEADTVKQHHDHFVKTKGVSSATAHELAIHHAGYDGYVNHDARMAVIMGHKKEVPVKHIGEKSKFEMEKRF
jgi:hypothetical protein